MTTTVRAAAFTSAPLRNRLRIELKAPVSEVWALVGDLSRMPDYSSGLACVEAQQGASGALAQYVCYFKPSEAGAPRIVHREFVLWYERDRGYASTAEDGNAFGLMNSLNLVTLELSEAGTMLTWEEYYDAPDLEMNRVGYDQALADIGDHLVRRFGGRVVERYVDGSSSGPAHGPTG